jgi:TusE/DsrC/DsvC family sulfur relay protein
MVFNRPHKEDPMSTLTFASRDYLVDDGGFLRRSEDWDEAFAEGVALRLGIRSGLTDAHWRVIRYIRESCQDTGTCPMVYQTCRANGLHLRDLKELFPTGYLRGACKAAGLTYREADLKTALLPAEARERGLLSEGKTYRIDARGFLVAPSEWDEFFAIRLARDLKMEGGLKEAHWTVIRFLRDSFQKSGEVPTVYETCEALGMSLEGLEELFPDGYHRGAVRISGLCAR